MSNYKDIYPPTLYLFYTVKSIYHSPGKHFPPCLFYRQSVHPHSPYIATTRGQSHGKNIDLNVSFAAEVGDCRREYYIKH